MRSTIANIYIKNLISNYTLIKKKCDTALICAAVKANAYGHGAVEVSKVLEKEGCNCFGVATVIEATELKNSGIKKPILLLSLTTPEEIKDIVEIGIEPIVTTSDYIKQLNTQANKKGRIINVHLKVDTGMGRIGCEPNEAIKLSKLIISSSNLKLQGLATHFATADSRDQTFTMNQLDIFKKVINELKEHGINPPLIHAANSGAITVSKNSIFNMVRPGIILYGYPPSPELVGELDLKPILELETKIVNIKKVPKGCSISYGRNYITEADEFIATLPIGYADGFTRSLTNTGEVWISGKLYPVVGNVCMDQIMIRVDKNVKLYDKVTIIGVKPGQPNAESIAKKIGTISYEVLTNIHRVHKYYIN